MRHNGVGRLWLPLLAVAVVLVVWLRTTGTEAAFAVTTKNPGNTVTAAADWKPPIISRATVLKTEGGIAGYVHSSGSFTVLANVVEDPSSNPPAGIANVLGNVGNLTGNATGVAMSASAQTVSGQSYAYASASQTVSTGLAQGSPGASITSSDRATPANTSTAFPFTVVVDNTSPSSLSVTTTNAGGSSGAGVPGVGDTITYTWSEIIDPTSIVTGWDGTGTQNVTVQITNKNGNGSSDQVNILDGTTGTTPLALGTYLLGSTGYVKSGTVTFGKPGDTIRSTMTWTGTGVTVTLGQVDTGGGTPNGVSTRTTGSWTPQSGPFDRAGNLSTTGVLTEPSSGSVKF